MHRGCKSLNCEGLKSLSPQHRETTLFEQRRAGGPSGDCRTWLDDEVENNHAQSGVISTVPKPYHTQTSMEPDMVRIRNDGSL